MKNKAIYFFHWAIQAISNTEYKSTNNQPTRLYGVHQITLMIHKMLNIKQFVNPVVEGVSKYREGLRS